MNPIKWIKESNRWKHLLGGVIIGLFAETWYGAGYTGAIAGAALEFKDYKYGTGWDWTDLVLTFLGAGIGHGIQILIKATI